jgi:hypothetical protein
MRQTRMCEFFSLKCRHTKSFLSLPPQVRRRVYEEAGIFHDEHIFLQPRPPRIWYTEFDEEDKAFQFIYNVLQTCRTIHDEVKHIICTENHLVVDQRNVEYGLYFLSRLSPQVCFDMTSLSVKLYRKAPRGSRSYGFDRTIIRAWHAAVGHVLTHAKPGRMTLHLVCETGDSESTRLILQPLNEHPGVLKECHIRLDPFRNGCTSNLAEEAALRAKGLDRDTESPFRFLDLPAEIRSNILTFTDLVTPTGEVQWSAKKGFGTISAHSWCGIGLHDDSVGAVEHAFQFWACQSWHPSLDVPFCRADMSAYSSRCKCWMPPKSLMLVNRSMYQDAMAVFYRCNRITVLPDPNAVEAYIGPGMRGRLNASRFITRHVEPMMLSYLRHLEFVFPGAWWTGASVDPENPDFLDWRFAIDHLRAQANLAGLKLIVHMRLKFERYHPPPRTYDHRRIFELHFTNGGSLQFAGSKTHLLWLQPLKVLREGGLQRLFVFLEWTWHWTPSNACSPHRCRFDPSPVDECTKEMEVWLEKRVMGDDYDSSKMGKMGEYPGQWMFNLD